MYICMYIYIYREREREREREGETAREECSTSWRGASTLTRAPASPLRRYPPLSLSHTHTHNHS